MAFTANLVHGSLSTAHALQDLLILARQGRAMCADDSFDYSVYFTGPRPGQLDLVVAEQKTLHDAGAEFVEAEGAGPFIYRNGGPGRLQIFAREQFPLLFECMDRLGIELTEPTDHGFTFRIAGRPKRDLRTFESWRGTMVMPAYLDPSYISRNGDQFKPRGQDDHHVLAAINQFAGYLLPMLEVEIPRAGLVVVDESIEATAMRGLRAAQETFLVPSSDPNTMLPRLQALQGLYAALYPVESIGARPT